MIDDWVSKEAIRIMLEERISRVQPPQAPVNTTRARVSTRPSTTPIQSPRPTRSSASKIMRLTGMADAADEEVQMLKNMLTPTHHNSSKKIHQLMGLDVGHDSGSSRSSDFYSVIESLREASVSPVNSNPSVWNQHVGGTISKPDLDLVIDEEYVDNQLGQYYSDSKSEQGDFPTRHTYRAPWVPGTPPCAAPLDLSKAYVQHSQGQGAQWPANNHLVSLLPPLDKPRIHGSRRLGLADHPAVSQGLMHSQQMSYAANFDYHAVALQIHESSQSSSGSMTSSTPRTSLSSLSFTSLSKDSSSHGGNSHGGRRLSDDLSKAFAAVGLDSRVNPPSLVLQKRAPSDNTSELGSGDHPLKASFPPSVASAVSTPLLSPSPVIKSKFEDSDDEESHGRRLLALSGVTKMFRRRAPKQEPRPYHHRLQHQQNDQYLFPPGEKQSYSSQALALETPRRPFDTLHQWQQRSSRSLDTLPHHHQQHKRSFEVHSVHSAAGRPQSPAPSGHRNDSRRTPNIIQATGEPLVGLVDHTKRTAGDLLHGNFISGGGGSAKQAVSEAEREGGEGRGFRAGGSRTAGP